MQEPCAGQYVVVQIFTVPNRIIIVAKSWVQGLDSAKTLNYGVNRSQTFLVYFNNRAVVDNKPNLTYRPNFAAQLLSFFVSDVEACYKGAPLKFFGKLYFLFFISLDAKENVKFYYYCSLIEERDFGLALDYAMKKRMVPIPVYNVRRIYEKPIPNIEQPTGSSSVPIMQLSIPDIGQPIESLNDENRPKRIIQLPIASVGHPTETSNDNNENNESEPIIQFPIPDIKQATAFSNDENGRESIIQLPTANIESSNNENGPEPIIRLPVANIGQPTASSNDNIEPEFIIQENSLNEEDAIARPSVERENCCSALRSVTDSNSDVTEELVCVEFKIEDEQQIMVSETDNQAIQDAGQFYFEEFDKEDGLTLFYFGTEEDCPRPKDQSEMVKRNDLLSGNMPFIENVSYIS